MKPELGIIFASAFKRIQNPVYDVNIVRRMTALDISADDGAKAKKGGRGVGEILEFKDKGLQKLPVTHWNYLAGRPGFEPGLTGPEPVVLPLDDPPEECLQIQYKKSGVLVKSILNFPVFCPNG